MINNSALQQISNQIKAEDIMQNPQRKNEIVKIILQTLENLGYYESFKILQNESKINLYNDEFSEFKDFIMEGKYENALKIIGNLSMTAENQKKASFLVLQQKYMETLEKNNIQEALNILRQQLIQFSSQTQLNTLSSYMVYASSPEILKRKSQWSGEGNESKKQLILSIQNQCNPKNTMNSNFMEKILKESILFQILKCPKHQETTNADFSLLEDHQCNNDPLPDTCISMLKGHNEEVWIAKFSNKGHKIASVSKNNTLIIWNFNIQNLEASQSKKIPKAHDKDIYSLQWSKSDKKILTASADRTIKLWNSEKGTLQTVLKGHQDIVCCAIYHPINNQIYSGGIDNFIIVWNQLGIQEAQIDSPRISDMIFTSDGKYLVILCASFRKINIVNTQTRQVEHVIEENESIISISLSNDNKFLLVNTSYVNPELHLYHLETKEIINYFDGYIQERFLVKCLIGGPNNSYVSCGSEDGKVMIWHKLNNKESFQIQAHKLPVNSMSFHPQNPSILLTSSDDESIKIWAPQQLVTQCQKINSDTEGEEIQEDQPINQQPQLIQIPRMELISIQQRQQLQQMRGSEDEQIQEAQENSEDDCDEEYDDEEQIEEDEENFDEVVFNYQNMPNQQNMDDEDQS